MKHKENCIACGAELEYLKKMEKMECIYCHKTFQSQVRCKEGHFVCDSCHSKNGIDFILEVCNKTEETNPYNIAELLFRDERIHIHGPEHHVLVPAVLLASYYNKIGEGEQKKNALEMAKARGQQVPGGFCGFAGSCGAGIGVGIFFSIMEDTSPLDSKKWGNVNQATGHALLNIGAYNGPRCCKRNTFLAFKTVEEMLKEEKGITLSTGKQVCNWSAYNNECLKEGCEFHRVNNKSTIINKKR